MAIGRKEEKQLRKLGAVKLPFGMGWVAPQHVLGALLDALEREAVQDAFSTRPGRSRRTMALRRAIEKHCAKRRERP